MSKYPYRWGDIISSQAINKYKRHEFQSGISVSQQRLGVAHSNGQQSQQQSKHKSNNMTDKICLSMHTNGAT